MKSAVPVSFGVFIVWRLMCADVSGRSQHSFCGVLWSSSPWLSVPVYMLPGYGTSKVLSFTLLQKHQSLPDLVLQIQIVSHWRVSNYLQVPEAANTYLNILNMFFFFSLIIFTLPLWLPKEVWKKTISCKQSCNDHCSRWTEMTDRLGKTNMEVLLCSPQLLLQFFT